MKYFLIAQSVLGDNIITTSKLYAKDAIAALHSVLSTHDSNWPIDVDDTVESILESAFNGGILTGVPVEIPDPKDIAKLRALEAYGVDNWEWYGDAMDSLEELELEDEDDDWEDEDAMNLPQAED